MEYLQIDLSATQTLPDPVVLQEQAPLLSEAGLAFEAGVSDAAGKWRALENLYTAPQDYLIFRAFEIPSRQALDLTESTAGAARAISDFAEAVRTVRATRSGLQRDVTTAENDLVSLLGSEEDPTGSTFENALFNYRSEFTARAVALAADYEQARTTCLALLSGIGRTSSDAPSYYASGALDLISHGAEHLYRQALSPEATPEDVQRYYDVLAGLDPAGYRAFAQDYPEAAVHPPRIGLAADRQAAFWQSLTPEQQAALAQVLPAVVGNTEGVPYGIRAAANVAVLALVMKPSWRASDAQRDAYKNIRKSLNERDSKETQTHLIAFDPADPPLAAVAVGNMDTATNVTVNVSGMGSSAGDMDGAVKAANNIYLEQADFISGHAVVAWIGYESPGYSAEVLYSDKARTGGAKLATVIDGFCHTRASDVPSVSIAAHSYGTTTAAYALSQTAHTVDSVVFYGSAGIDPEAARTAADLNAREVYATQGDADVLAPGGIAGANLGDPRWSPTAESWGAKVFSSEDQGRGVVNGGHGMEGTEDEAAFWETERGGGYLDPATSSLAQIALASTGRGSSLGLISQSPMDDRVDNITETANDMYYGPGRVVDGMQVLGRHAVDEYQEAQNGRAEMMREGLLQAGDVLQDHYLPDFGPYEHPLDPHVDEMQREAMDALEESQRRFIEAVDCSQNTFSVIVDNQQKAADDYFKRRLRVLEFKAGRLVEIFRD